MGNFDQAVVLYALAIYAAAVISPGPNFAVVSRLAVQGKRLTAAGVVAGVAVTSTFYAVLAMTGLALVLSQIGWLARAVQIAGGLYLIYLGVSAWVSTRADQTEPQGDPLVEFKKRDFLSGFKVGSIVSLSNPKTIAFFTSLYAAAVPFDASLATKSAILLGGFSIEVLWYTGVLLVLSTQRMRSVYQRWVTWVERGIGTVLAYFGVRLIFDRA